MLDIESPVIEDQLGIGDNGISGGQHHAAVKGPRRAQADEVAAPGPRPASAVAAESELLLEMPALVVQGGKAQVITAVGQDEEILDESTSDDLSKFLEKYLCDTIEKTVACTKFQIRIEIIPLNEFMLSTFIYDG